jgi:hypothetical protein
LTRRRELSLTEQRQAEQIEKLASLLDLAATPVDSCELELERYTFCYTIAPCVLDRKVQLRFRG